jgi:hypothetical protein
MGSALYPVQSINICTMNIASENKNVFQWKLCEVGDLLDRCGPELILLKKF